MTDLTQPAPLSKEQIGQVQYLIEQSIKGHHVLFDVETLRHILSPAAENADDFSQALTEDEAQSIEGHIENLLRQPSLAHKRAYLEALDERVYAWVVKAYFSMIESNLLESQEVRH